MGAVTHVSFVKDSESGAGLTCKSLFFLFLPVLSPYLLCSHPSCCAHTRTDAHTSSDIHIHLRGLSELSLPIFFLELSSAALLPFGKASGQRATWLWALAAFCGCETVGNGNCLGDNSQLSLGRRSLLLVWAISPLLSAQLQP